MEGELLPDRMRLCEPTDYRIASAIRRASRFGFTS